jgi:uncharacterized membrane protein YedE/YeeE
MQLIAPLAGGALIGLAASLLWLSHGRVAGISGLTSAVVEREPSPVALPFVLGLVVAGALLRLAFPSAFGAPAVGLGLTALAGLAVGFGTRLGGGCTSGHGVCGVSRVSARSIVATLTFMATGALATFAVMHLGGGAR